jgi:uncharacterized protein YjiS (DUF1127 family)
LVQAEGTVTISVQNQNEPNAIIGDMPWIKFHHLKRKTEDMTLQNILTVHPFEGFHNIIQQFRADHAERRRARAVYNRTWRELSAMSGRERADIGIHSSDIPRIASEAAAMSRKT